MFVTNWISTTKIQKISEITNFFRHYFLSRTEVIFAKDKLHSAKYSSKLDILRSFALSLHMKINNFNNYIFNLKDNDETNYNNRMCNCADG